MKSDFLLAENQSDGAGWHGGEMFSANEIIQLKLFVT